MKVNDLLFRIRSEKSNKTTVMIYTHFLHFLMLTKLAYCNENANNREIIFTSHKDFSDQKHKLLICLCK